MNHCPNHLSCSFYVFKNLEKAPPPKSADCLHHCFQMEPPTSPRLPRPTSFFFMAEGPADVSWGVVVPARLISWLFGWLTLYLENVDQNPYAFLRETLHLFGRGSMSIWSNFGNGLCFCFQVKEGNFKSQKTGFNTTQFQKSRIHTAKPCGSSQLYHSDPSRKTIIVCR